MGTGTVALSHQGHESKEEQGSGRGQKEEVWAQRKVLGVNGWHREGGQAQNLPLRAGTKRGVGSTNTRDT